MQTLIVIIAVGLILLISGIFLSKVRRLEQAGAKLETTESQRQFITLVPGVLFGILACQWFYRISEIKNTLFSSVPLERQLADLVCITAFCGAGIFFADRLIHIARIFSQRRIHRNAN